MKRDLLLDPVVTIRPAFDEDRQGLILMGIGDIRSTPIRLRTGDTGELRFTLPDGSRMNVKLEVWED